MHSSVSPELIQRSGPESRQSCHAATSVNNTGEDDWARKMRSNLSRNFTFILFQDLALLGAIALACYLRYLYDIYDLFTYRTLGGVLVMYGVIKVAYHYFDLYEVSLHISFREFIKNLLKAFVTSVFILTAIYYIYKPAMIGQGILALSVIFCITITVLYRLLWGEISEESSFMQRALVLGTGKLATTVLEDVIRYGDSGYRIVGVVAENRVEKNEVLGFRVLGSADSLPTLCAEHRAHLVIVALDEQRGFLPTRELMEVKLTGVRIIDNVTFHERFAGKIVLESLRPSWFVFTDGFKVGRLRLFSKRAFDLITAMTGLIVAAPLWVPTAILVKLTSRGPILYKQERVGLGGETFQLLKFRSMRVDAEDATGPVWARENDDRVTPIGHYIRRFRIDEIPQMFNVLNGEMSFVGPRPERPFFVKRLTEQLHYYSQRHVVKPGITGWAQVRYPYGATVEDAKEKLQLDLYYIKHTNLAFDIKILLETTKIIFRKMAR